MYMLSLIVRDAKTTHVLRYEGDGQHWAVGHMVFLTDGKLCPVNSSKLTHANPDHEVNKGGLDN